MSQKTRAPLSPASASAGWDAGSHQHCSSLLLPLLSLAFTRSSENLPKVPLQSWHHEAEVFPPLVLQPGTPPITVPASQPSHNILVPVMPCCADLPSDLLPLYYKSYEEHKLFNKFGRPVWKFKLPFNFLFFFLLTPSIPWNFAELREEFHKSQLLHLGFQMDKNWHFMLKGFFDTILLSPHHVQKSTFQTRVPGLQAS